jgi:5-methylcytosine-specific restriction endonuclease McrA
MSYGHLNPNLRSVPAGIRKKILENRQYGYCANGNCRKYNHYTGNKLDYRECETDHIIEFKLGGKTVFENLQVLCIPCHKRKSQRFLKQIQLQRRFEMKDPDIAFAYSR